MRVRMNLARNFHPEDGSSGGPRKVRRGGCVRALRLRLRNVLRTSQAPDMLHWRCASCATYMELQAWKRFFGGFGFASLRCKVALWMLVLKDVLR